MKTQSLLYHVTFDIREMQVDTFSTGHVEMWLVRDVIFPPQLAKSLCFTTNHASLLLSQIKNHKNWMNWIRLIRNDESHDAHLVYSSLLDASDLYLVNDSLCRNRWSHPNRFVTIRI